MKLVSFLHHQQRRYGVITGQGILDLTERMVGLYGDLKQLLAIGNGVPEQVGVWLSQGGTMVAPEDVQFLPVIDNPGKIICVGHNYEAHRIETQHDATEHPTLFLRSASSQVGHNAPMLCPPESEMFDFEGEIAVIIGTAGRRIPRDQALTHIAGFACYNDGSVRDWQNHTSQWTAGKNFDATGAFGPWMLLHDGSDILPVMTLITRLNGEEVQHTTTEYLIRGFDELIAYISTFTTLEPGDVIVTGTPGGIGARRTPPLFMRPGDIVEVDIDCIGVLRNTIRPG